MLNKERTNWSYSIFMLLLLLLLCVVVML